MCNLKHVDYGVEFTGDRNTRKRMGLVNFDTDGEGMP
jgi:hypothetical protein